MQPAIHEARPPYVTFEIRAVEDRAASISAGHYVPRDEYFAIITPQGSKDRTERQVDSWFSNLDAQVQQGRFESNWLRQYREQYSAWKDGREMPLSGTAILTWPALSPAQVKLLLDARLKTVEDLASANEETISRLGMGGRALKQRAIEWLAAAGNTGKIAEEMAALKVRNEQLESVNLQLQTQLADLSATVDRLATTSPRKL